jgi:hypothetical protein
MRSIIICIAIAACGALLYWLGYSDGRLAEQEKHEFKKLDKLIAKVGGLHVPQHPLGYQYRADGMFICRVECSNCHKLFDMLALAPARYYCYECQPEAKAR